MQATISSADGRWTVQISGIPQAGFALFQHSPDATELRRTDRGYVESVFLAGLPDDLGESHIADVASLSHPDAWPSPASEVAPEAPALDPASPEV